MFTLELSVALVNGTPSKPEEPIYPNEVIKRTCLHSVPEGKPPKEHDLHHQVGEVVQGHFGPPLSAGVLLAGFQPGMRHGKAPVNHPSYGFLIREYRMVHSISHSLPIAPASLINEDGLRFLLFCL